MTVVMAFVHVERARAFFLFFNSLSLPIRNTFFVLFIFTMQRWVAVITSDVIEGRLSMHSH